MTIRIKCKTIFDITATGVRNQFKEVQVPIKTDDGKTVTNFAEWACARNQQRNWETLNQLISLRTLPENISIPVHDEQSDTWSFEFDVINPETVSIENADLKLLLKDCTGVPMLKNIGNTDIATEALETQSLANIWFYIITNK